MSDPCPHDTFDPSHCVSCLREQLAAVQPLVDAVNRALDAYGRRGVTLKESTEHASAEFDRECPASAFPNLGARMQRLATWTSERHARIRGDLEDAVAPFASAVSEESQPEGFACSCGPCVALRGPVSWANARLAEHGSVQRVGAEWQGLSAEAKAAAIAAAAKGAIRG